MEKKTEETSGTSASDPSVSRVDKPRNERSQEKVFWKTGGTETGERMATLV